MIGTPTVNAMLPLRRGGFADLREALDYAAAGDTGLNFFDARAELVDSLTYRELRARAYSTAGWMQEYGLKSGQHVSLVAETSAAFLTLFYALHFAGLVPCPLPYHAFPGGRTAYVRQLAAIHAATGAQWLLVPRGLLVCAQEAVGAHGNASTFERWLDRPDAPALAPAVPQEAAPVYVQFSSGSTSAPKGVQVTSEALMANANAIAQHGLRMREDDRACSWLPLYHDMGLIGFSVVALCSQRSVDYMSPATFAGRPGSWLTLMSHQHSSISYAPGFAWRLAAARCHDRPGLDLSRLRIAGIGGDRIRTQELDEFAIAMAPAGFTRNAFQPSYGLAEATLAVTMGDPDQAPRVDQLCGAVGHVGCGRPLPGNEVEVRDAGDLNAGERVVGTLWVRGPALMRGYLHPFGEAALDAEGWLDTGDLGYLLEGELFVTGRKKDLIMFRGRNLWPQDVERIAATAASVAETQIAAIGVEEADTTRLVVLIQTGALDSPDWDRTVTQVTAAVLAGFGAAPRVVRLPPRALPFTTSGKLARGTLRERYLAGAWDANPTTTETME